MFFLSNYVGTPTLTRALPVIKRYSDQQVVLVGNFTGAQPQREAPYVEHVFNVRASYRQEMAALVERFWQMGARTFGVYSQADAYGRSGTDGVARALAARGARVAAETTYQRGAKFEDDMAPAVNALRRAGVDAVLCTGAYQGCGAFVRTARDLGWTVPISNVSFVGSDAMLRLLIQHGKTTGRDYTRALVNSQVVPSYDDVSLPGVVEYRGLMDRYNPALPAALRDDKYVPQRYSFISLGGLRERARDGGGAPAGGAESDPSRLPAGAGVAQGLRPRHRRAADLRPRASPGTRQRLLHARRRRAVGAHHRLDLGHAGLRRGTGHEEWQATIRPPGQGHPVPGRGAHPAGGGDVARSRCRPCATA